MNSIQGNSWQFGHGREHCQFALTVKRNEAYTIKRCLDTQSCSNLVTRNGSELQKIIQKSIKPLIMLIIAYDYEPLAGNP